MSYYIRLCFVVGIVACLAAPAMALTPDEVLVVANGTSPDSVALAQSYAQARQIPASQIAVLNVESNYTISRLDYESQIHRPLAQFLVSRNLASKIRCVVLMWGMPLRVESPIKPGSELNSVYKAEATKCHYRLATDYKLLSSVCRKFPPPRTDGLLPVTDLFESPAPAPQEPLPAWAALAGDVDKLLADKLQEFLALSESAHREVAARQLMALSLDLHGLAGLIKFISDARLTDAPDPNELRKQLDEALARQKDLRAKTPDAQSVADLTSSLMETGGLIAAGDYAQQQSAASAVSNAGVASVDSELSLLWQGNYPIENFVANPLYWRGQAKLPPNMPPMLMTCRIDGPTRGDAARIIKDSIEVEATGLQGTFYVDAGGPERAKNYDETFRKLVAFLRGKTSLKVVFDEAPTVFPAGSCPQAALYCGWYSLQKYVAAFDWVKGSVGWHVASFEAVHLHDPSSDEWCVKMIQNGVAATVGAVEEPFLGSFPMPEEFFPLLLTGKYTLAECYWRTLPLTSWRLTLIGDPLYNPFKNNPAVDVKDLPAGMAPPPVPMNLVAPGVNPLGTAPTQP
ncbi:MAG: TIGR03790 family protein [Phycisphaerae bacterium]|jgi:uncharacterized protein (TIGR03790 family)